MLFPNWSGWKTVKLVLAAATALSPTVVPGTYQALVASVLSGVLGVVVILSGTGLGPAQVKS
jgi:hypothetical protein